MDYPKIFAKLINDLRFIKDEVCFSDLKCGWFEIIFTNPLDLKKWYIGFDPHTESISSLDLWIRIHRLLVEYANYEALSAILELNGFGTLIKLDPIHNKRN
ncbi:hypothetical protein V2J09_022590 [Rumex salicifolius]